MSINRMTKAELVILLAQRNAELEAARSRISVLEADTAALRSRIVREPNTPSTPSVSAALAARARNVVYEWDPKVPGDFKAKAELVKQFGGSLRRMQEQRA